MATFAVGDLVRCEREAPAKGTWKNYVGRVGTVVVADNYGEVGVSFDREDPIGNRRSADSWFLPSELVAADSATAPLA